MSIIVSGVCTNCFKSLINWSVAWSSAFESLSKLSIRGLFISPPPTWFTLSRFPSFLNSHNLWWNFKLSLLLNFWWQSWHSNLSSATLPGCCFLTCRSKCWRCINFFLQKEQEYSIGAFNASLTVAILKLVPSCFQLDWQSRMRLDVGDPYL